MKTPSASVAILGIVIAIAVIGGTLYFLFRGETNQTTTISTSTTQVDSPEVKSALDTQLTYKSDNGAWKISNENWDYKILNITVAGGATTFPEWQKVGPIDASRRSPDWLHNFAWDYGGPGLAVLVWGYVFIIAALILSKSVRKPSE